MQGGVILNYTVNDAESETQQPWNLWFRQAEEGKIEAIHNIIMASQPIISSLSNIRLFQSRMSKDDICSNANYVLLRFIKKRRELPTDKEVPFLIRHVLKCGLTDCIRSMEVREEHEQLAIAVKLTNTYEDDAYTENDCYESYVADTRTEPETHCLNSELCDMVREAVQQLPEDERTVIQGFYYQNKGMKEIAQELNCTFQNAYKTRRSAYTHLKKLLKKTVYA